MLISLAILIVVLIYAPTILPTPIKSKTGSVTIGSEGIIQAIFNQGHVLINLLVPAFILTMVPTYLFSSLWIIFESALFTSGDIYLSVSLLKSSSGYWELAIFSLVVLAEYLTELYLIFLLLKISAAIARDYRDKLKYQYKRFFLVNWFKAVISIGNEYKFNLGIPLILTILIAMIYY